MRRRDLTSLRAGPGGKTSRHREICRNAASYYPAAIIVQRWGDSSSSKLPECGLEHSRLIRLSRSARLCGWYPTCFASSRVPIAA